jgi:hypothetical protein
MYLFKKQIWLTAALLLTLTACGGSKEVTTTTVTEAGGSGSDTGGTLSGRVIDSSVGSARVCFDMNNDSQCTTGDSYVETDAEGYYEISYEEETIVEEYHLIADVRSSESTDADYASGTPDYDYVMHAFDQGTGKPNIISPLTTYMNYEQRNTGAPAETVASNTVQVIDQYEQYTYAEEVEIEYEYTEYVQGDFISNKDSADQHKADFNQRVHNLNEMMARQMQESQAVWEDRFYSGDVTVDSFDWSDNSHLVVTNANSSVFQGFEVIVEEVTSYEHGTFDALEVSDSLWVDVPSATEINNLLAYISARETYSNEFTGNTYRHSISFNGSLSSYGYFVISSGSVTYYVENVDNFGDNFCVFANAPFPSSGSLSESDFVSQMNSAFQEVNQQGGGIFYSDLARVSAPPSGCSSVGDVLANIDTATSIETASEGDIYDNSVRPDQNWSFPATSAVLSVASPVKLAPSSLSSNFSTGTLSTCSYGGVNYATNPCRTPTKKE